MQGSGLRPIASELADSHRRRANEAAHGRALAFRRRWGRREPGSRRLGTSPASWAPSPLLASGGAAPDPSDAVENPRHGGGTG